MIKIITDAAEARALRNRDIESYGNYADTVRAILADVAARGDEALLESGRRFDCPTLESLTVTEEEIDEAIASLPAEVLETIKTCAENIAHYHRRQVREGFTERKENGCVIGQRILPLERVGVYVPGGTASYPSTVLMNVIPAAIAGVPEIFVTTPQAATVRSPLQFSPPPESPARRESSNAAAHRLSPPSPTAQRLFPRSRRSPAPVTYTSRLQSARSSVVSEST